jgi:hypothetical protein
MEVTRDDQYCSLYRSITQEYNPAADLNRFG